MILKNILNNALSLFNPTYSITSADNDEVLLEFDTIESLSVTASAIATKYPLEDGFYSTDYKYRNPDTIKIVGIISKGGALGAGSVFKKMNTFDRASSIAKIKDNLNLLINNLILVNIQTRNSGLYKNQTLIGFSINENFENYGNLEVQMQFQEVCVFESVFKTPSNPSLSDTTDSGLKE